MRYIATDNTNAAAYGGWELIDMAQTPPRTFALCMAEHEAKHVAQLLNANPIPRINVTELSNGNFVCKGEVYRTLAECVAWQRKFWPNAEVFVARADAATDAFWTRVPRTTHP